MTTVLSLPKKRVHHTKDGIHIFVNPYWGGKFVTDDRGARVIALMDTADDEEELIDLIAGELGINPYEAAARFLTFSDELKKRRMPGEADARVDGVPKPDTGFLEITRTCATRCRLCYIDSGDGGPGTLDTNEISGVIDQMVEMGVRFVALSGGDPLTRGDLPEILRYIVKDRGLTAGLSTSLLTLTEDVAQEMKELGVLVQVSMDGSTAKINDWNRGQGSFDKAAGGITLLQKYGIPFRFAYVINRHNVEDAEGMIELSLRLGAKEVAFGKVKIAGRAKGLRAEAYPSTEEMASVYHTLYRKEVEMRQTGLIIRCKHNQALLTGLGERVGCLPCGAGRTFVQVSYNGDIVPCSLLSGERAYVLGNVRRDRISDVWEHSPVYGFFRNTTAEDMEICGDCPAKYLCGGGCRADAYLNCGNLLGPCGDCEDLLLYYRKILDRGCTQKNVTAF